MVKITLDKERNMKLSMRGMLAFEDTIGRSIFKKFNLSTMSFRELSTVMWASLLHEDKELKFDDFIDMVDLSDITRMKAALAKCILEALPESEGTDPLVGKPKKSRTG